MAPEIYRPPTQEGPACSNDRMPAPHITRGLLPTSHEEVCPARAGRPGEGAEQEDSWAGGAECVTDPSPRPKEALSVSWEQCGPVVSFQVP